MADDQGRFLGQDVKLYVGTSAPTDVDDASDAAYTLVGLLIDNPFEGSAEVITAADKAASGFTSSLAGTKSYTVNVEAHRKNVPEAGQVIVRDAWVAGTNLYWLIGNDTTGDGTVSGQASVTAYSEASPNDAYATMSATLNGQGTPTFGTAT